MDKHSQAGSSGASDKTLTASECLTPIVKQAVQTPTVYKGMAGVFELFELVRPISSIFKFAAHRTPVIGSVMSAAQDVGEIQADLRAGSYGKTGAAALGGVVEVVGNLVGFGVGDNLREGIRAAVVKTAGEEYAIDKSDMRTAAETVGKIAAIRQQKDDQKKQNDGAAYSSLKIKFNLLDEKQDYPQEIAFVAPAKMPQPKV